MNRRFYSLLITAFVLLARPQNSSAFVTPLKREYSNRMLPGKKPVAKIKYQGKTIQLNERALYLNPRLKESELGSFAFKSLQDVVRFAKDGTEETPTVIYMEPDVYWTDDPKSDNRENKLIGLLIPQANITLIGLDGNPEHTIIAGNRGQMAGAIGNWNTVGVGDGFKAYNITFGNYCNEDLVYPLDPSKNLPKRQSTITQAQVLTKAHNGNMDKWIFDNCRFISYLNTFAAGNQPHRAYYKNCFLQCTDDAVGSGDFSVFEKCHFRFFANHPSWGGSRILQAYLGCYFETVLRDPGANSTIFFAKNNNIFAVLDANFKGNATSLEWTDVPADHVRHYVYNNILNGGKVKITTSKPNLSVTLGGKSLAAYKVGSEYNIYNLLRGNDDWDPANQKARMANYKDLPLRMDLIADKLKLNGATKEIAQVRFNIYPDRIKTSTPLKWSVSDRDLLAFAKNQDGTITVTATNTSDSTKRAFLKAETEQGIQAITYFEVTGIPQNAPLFTRKPIMNSPDAGLISLNYKLNLGNREDISAITWYRSLRKDGSDTVKVAVSTTSSPLKDYPLSTGDIGFYLFAQIYPKHSTSVFGEPVLVGSRKIISKDIMTTSIKTDFKNLPTDRTLSFRKGFWLVDTHRPKDLSRDFQWTADTGKGWEYGWGSDATKDRQGLMTVGRGARLIYMQGEQKNDMHLVLKLSPHKAAGQGFGSATGQYLDVYIKYDPMTQSGYGLRIERTPKFGNGVQFTLYKFTNGLGTPISEHQYSSAFLPGCKLDLDYSGKTLRAKVSTSSSQQQGQKDAGLPHEVSLMAEVAPNLFGSFGLQHTGSTGTASRIMLEGLEVSYGR
ncbi:hypothetical protein [Desertivirga arenae]|uniref:hypothetical protein n=1 Tax=Desertivirga arenae TaxID=2810309 RepID=UPI001A95E8D0|nr:hypothetical protein [Pedobacter sp. SYSU D00823]